MPRSLLVVAAIVLLPSVAEGQRRYEFTPNSVLEAHGDTIYWMQNPAPPRVDTVLYVIRKDSTVRWLRPAPARELPEEIAKHFRFLWSEAQARAEVMLKLETLPKRP